MAMGTPRRDSGRTAARLCFFHHMSRTTTRTLRLKMWSERKRRMTALDIASSTLLTTPALSSPLTTIATDRSSSIDQPLHSLLPSM